MSIPLNVSASATFAANGTASVSLGPTVYGSSWTVKRMVTTTTSVGQARLNTYLNVVSESAKVGGTYSGNADTNDSEVPLGTLDKLIFVWDSGDPGAIATIILSGDVDTGR